MVTQLYPTLCDPMNYIVHGILRARILEWVAFPSPGDLPDPGSKPRCPTLQSDSLPTELQGKPAKVLRWEKTWSIGEIEGWPG